jgi:hypothetical protein
MAKSGILNRLQLTLRHPDELCNGCQFNKQHQMSFLINLIQKKSIHPGKLIHGDIWGLFLVPSKGELIYFILFKDGATSFFCLLKFQKN